MGADIISRKEERNTNETQWQVKKSELKNTEIWKAKRKAMDTNTGESLQDTRVSSNSLETYLVRKCGTLDTYEL